VHYEIIIGTPNGLCFPSGLAIHTRRTGCGRYVLLFSSCVSSSNHFLTPYSSMSSNVWPASSVLRAPPPSHTAWPVSRELPVDPYRDHRWDFPCCVWSPMCTCRRQYPGRSDGTCSLVQFHSLRPSHETGAGRLLHHCFRGLLSVHSRYGLHARQVALRLSAPEASAVSLPPLLL